MQSYCLGFAFNHTSYRHARVLLVEKNRPKWQAGRLNGVGGKIQGDEKPIDAMTREFYEETNIATGPGQWRHFFTHTDGPGKYIMYVYRATLSESVFDTHRSMTDELIIPIPAIDLPGYCIFNLNWMIPLAFDLNLLSVPVVGPRGASLRSGAPRAAGSSRSSQPSSVGSSCAWCCAMTSESEETPKLTEAERDKVAEALAMLEHHGRSEAAWLIRDVLLRRREW